VSGVPLAMHLTRYKWSSGIRYPDVQIRSSEHSQEFLEKSGLTVA
jgi:hypothetical protein